MRKIIPLTALVLGLTGGVALADHGRGGDHRSATVEHRAAPARQVVRGNVGRPEAVRDHRGYANVGYDRGYNRGFVGGYNRGGGRVVVNNGGYRGNYGYRRPIYVSRPIIRERYYNYYRRPSLIVENYNPMAGYFWIAGTWTWNGGEWIWQPGHYEPDAAYGYYDGY